MIELLIELGMAPLLAAVATATGRRFGARTGGLVSAFPAIVGPVLLVDALDHGPAFAARAADGTLLGLISLSAFALAYSRGAAAGRGWPLCLASGWAAAGTAALTIGVTAGRAGAPVGFITAVASLALAALWLRRPQDPRSPQRDPGPPAAHGTGIPTTMAITAGLVFSLSTAAGALGPVVGGMLAALPVLASVLTVLTHRDGGGAAAVALLRGTVSGMAGFVAFCEVVALLIAHGGTATALAAATVAALALMVPASRPLRVWPGGQTSRHPQRSV